MSSAPLAGTLVVDLSRHLPGPLTAKILRDLGARVVKVEEPELGDPVRHVPPFRDGTGSLAALLLDGTESLALDLKRVAARRVLEELLTRADVLLESFRPGTMERLGLAPKSLAAAHARLVICSISGWGAEGAEASRSGHDLTYQAVAGSLAPTGRMPAQPTADLLGAWSAATAILAALVERERTGRGAILDAALLDAAVHGNLAATAADVASPRGVGERLMLSGALPCYGLYRTRDGGLVALAALEPKFWKRFCLLVGRKDLVAYHLETSGVGRRMVEAVLAGRSRSAWARFFAEHDLPGEPVLSVSEARDHPRVAGRRLIRTAGDGLPRLGFPALFDGERPTSRDSVPVLGSDTERILAELDLSGRLGSRRRRRAAGVGRRTTLRRMLWRLVSRSSG